MQLQNRYPALLLSFVVSVLVCPVTAHAASTRVPRGAVQITSAEEISKLRLRYRGKRIDLYCRGPRPGVKRRINRKAMFVPLSTSLRFTTFKISKKQASQIIRLAKKECEDRIAPPPNPEPDPTPTPDPAPDPVPQPNPNPEPDPIPVPPPPPPPLPGDEFKGDENSLAPYRENLSLSEVRSLLGKAAFGGTPELEQLCINQGLTPCIDALLNYSDPASVTNTANAIRNTDDANLWRVIWKERAFHTYNFLKGNPLHGVMTLMMHDWFAVNYWEQAGGDHGYADPTFIEHSDAIRAEALGNFEKFAHSMGLDTLMSFWLDNRLSRKGAVTVNYSREMLELFILGTRPLYSATVNYTRDDVYALGRAFTGYEIDAPGERWAAVFDINRWDSDPKTLFAGKPYAATANFKHNDAITHVLYNHPESAKYIAGKIFAELAHPYPSQGVIDALAAELKNNAFALKPVLRRILLSSAMFSPRSLNVCVSSPVEFFTSFARRLGLPVTANLSSTLNFAELSSGAGQILLQPTSVFGWRGCGVNRDGRFSWGERWLQPGGLLARINGITSAMNTAQQSASFFSNHRLVTDATVTPEAAVAAICEPFNLRLHSSETSLLTGYLQTFSGSFRAWSSLTAPQKRLKIAGLTEICATHPRRFLR